MTRTPVSALRLYPGELTNGGLLGSCRACGIPLYPEMRRTADGCRCNAPRGVNHGLVAELTCTCDECDPEGTGSSRNVLAPWTLEETGRRGS